MDSTDFYIVLPSNTITNVFQNNLSSEYEIPLPKPLEFGQVPWEVALVELFYPHTWENIHSPFLSVKFGALSTEGKLQYYKEKLASGYYSKVEDLVNEINSLKPEQFNGKLSVNKANKRIKIRLHTGEAIEFHPIMAKLLGFNDTFYINIEGETRHIIAPNIANIHASMQNIYVYSNVVKETLVGNGYYPLLRIINTEGEHGENIHKSFLNPFYHQVSLDRFNSIKITLCDDQGQAVPFQFGKVICKLHFKRKKIQLL